MTTLHGAVAQHAALDPDRIAVECDDDVLTYGELVARARRLARRLRRHGVGPGTVVAICVERSAQMVVGLLGLLEAGGAYVALDPTHPAARIAFVLRDTATPLVVTDRGSATAIPRGAQDVILLEDDDDPPGQGVSPAAFVGECSDAGRLAYVTYTSGSTGEPKGVLVTHAGVDNLVRGQQYVDVTPDDKVAALATLAFDASTFEVWAPLMNGGTCVVYSFAGQDVYRLLEQMAHDAITVLHLTSPVFRLLGPEHFRLLSGVRSLLFGGDAVRTELGASAARCFDGDLVHLYGPSETTGFATYHDVRGDGLGLRNIPIGLPLRNVVTRVLSPDRTPMQDGDVGELYIGGTGVAQGYLNQPELSAERFVSDPADGARLYRTGDLVRRHDNGVLQFLGRVDRQVKVRGFRVEPAEIEHAIAALTQVDDAVVVARDDGLGDKRLDAYVVVDAAGPEGRPDVDDGALVAAIRRHLTETLPRHQVPASITLLKALPLTSNLKIDEAQLPAPTETGSGTVDGDARPCSALEGDLLRICRDVLASPEFAVDDDFFDMGGDSISAFHVVAEATRTTGERIDVTSFFENPTVRFLAAAIGSSSGPQRPDRSDTVAAVPESGT